MKETNFENLLNSIGHEFFREINYGGLYIIPKQLVDYKDMTWIFFQACCGCNPPLVEIMFLKD